MSALKTKLVEVLMNFLTIPFFIGILIGILITGIYAESHFSNYYEVHPTNIGGFVIKNNRIFNLTQLRDDTYKAD